MCVCVSECVHVRTVYKQETALEVLELELQALMSLTMWVLRTKPRSSARANTLNH